MKWDAVIYLLTQSVSQDTYHQQHVTYSPRKVYANKFSVGLSSFSEAGEKGLRPDLIFQINALDYQGEAMVEVAGEKYHVDRAPISGDRATLYLVKGVGDNG
jgi:hypothetical protein